MNVLWPTLLLILGIAAGCVHAHGKQERSAASGQSLEKDAKRLEGATTADANELVLRGVAVYREQYCGTCHRFDRAETSGIFGPSHNGFATIAKQRIRSDTYSGNATTAAQYVRESIVDPDAYNVPGYPSGWQRMPPYIDLSPEDLEALVQLLLSGE